MTKRKLHINNEEWTYSVGKQFIPVWSPEGVKTLTDKSEVTGIAQSEIERRAWKGNPVPIKPGMIKSWIINNVINKGVSMNET